jgi:hypothetical protein
MNGGIIKMEYDVNCDEYGFRYYKKGTNILHRRNGPAIETANGDKYFYINGERHREDGPAIERSMFNWFYKEWHINGKLHRKNGPAVESANGYKEWWINGKRLSDEKEAILNEWWDNKDGI